MSQMISVQTTDPFGISSTFPERVRRVAPSTLNLSLLDENIQKVLSSWEEMRDAPLGRYADVPAVHVIGRPYPETPVDAVDYIRDVLQVARGAVFPAVDVPERTFHNWKKKPSMRPRHDSVTKLWSMVDALFYLQASHPNIAAWYHATPAAQSAFGAGDVNRLLQLELEHVNANSESLTTARIPAPHFGDPGDSAGPADSGQFDDRADEGERRSLAQAVPRVRTGPRRRVALPARAPSNEDGDAPHRDR